MNQLKTLFFTLLIWGSLLSSKAWAQINYNEDFESESGWSDTESNYYIDSPFNSCGNLTLITFLWSEMASGMELISSSPSIGVSNGGEILMTYDYALVQYSFNELPLLNDPAWGSVKCEYSTSETGPWTQIDIITPENHVESATCATRTLTFTPEEGSEVYVRFNVLVSTDSGVDALVYLDNITAIQTEPCQTAAPDALLTNQILCTNSNIGDLDIADYNDIIWYNIETGGEPLASNILLENGTYYAAQFDGCESIERIAVTVTVNVVEEPEAVAQTFCNSAVVDDLQVVDAAAEVNWYANENGGLPLSADTVIASGVYYVSQIEEGCESARTAVSVTVNVVDDPAAVAQTFCNSAVVGDLQVVDDTAEVNWYDSAESETALADDAVISTGTYYVSQIDDDCESARTAVSITVNIVDEPEAAAQTFCNSAVVSDLQVVDNEVEVNWYISEEGETALADDVAVSTGIYYVSHADGDCESVRIPVSVTVNVVDEPIVQSPQIFETSPVLLYDIAAEAEGAINWYATEEDAEEGVSPLSETITVTESGIYYITQTINGCESEPFEVAIEILLSTNEFDVEKITGYPNPVKDVFTLSGTAEIDYATVFNLIGQEVMHMKMNQNNQIDMSSLSSGPYIVTLSVNSTIIQFKVIKE